MSRENQIEEIDVMANDIAMTCPDLVNDGCGRRSCVECLANGMSDLGYRKASEVAAEIFAEIEEYLECVINYATREKEKHYAILGGFTYDTYSSGLDGELIFARSLKDCIAELKKKYTEDEG